MFTLKWSKKNQHEFPRDLTLTIISNCNKAGKDEISMKTSLKCQKCSSVIFLFVLHEMENMREWKSRGLLNKRERIKS